MEARLQTWWPAGIVLALILGAGLRLVWVEDMEYKYDEAWTYWQTQGQFSLQESPWLGLYTSTGVRNPGMSVWVFIALAKLGGVTEPTGLARMVQLSNVAALGLLTWFALRVVRREEREPWLWSVALAAVNPLAVCFHRKIWPPSVLPLFTMVLLLAWWHRERRGAAFFWGLLAAVIGQIHPSGFFFAAGFFAWALLFDRGRPAWRWCFGGAALGALPLAPWLVYLVEHRADVVPAHRSWMHALEGKFWIRWATEPFGLGLDYELFNDMPRFLCYPILGGQPTYLVGLLHVGVVVMLFGILGRAAVAFLRDRSTSWFDRFRGRASETAFTLNASLWGFGILLTLSCLPQHRHYMILLFPLEFLWLARLTLGPQSPTAPGSSPDDVFRRASLALLVAVQFLITASFLAYIHETGGSLSGDYGPVYRFQTHLATGRDNYITPVLTIPEPTR